MSTSQKTVFITGATSGFGLACAERFAGEGHKVIISGRREDRLQSLAKKLGSNAHAITLDVRDEAAVKKAVASLPKNFADVDVLVNNAGLALGLENFERQKMSDLEQMIDTNIKGMVYCTQALLPGMIDRERGHIINIGSTACTYPYPGGNVYGATKAFVLQFGLNLRADLLGKNIRVTTIAPGMAETEFSLVRFAGDKAKADDVYKGVNALKGEDVAESVYWCAMLPEHVNINRLELMPTQQAFGPFAFDRK